MAKLLLVSLLLCFLFLGSESLNLDLSKSSGSSSPSVSSGSSSPSVSSGSSSASSDGKKPNEKAIWVGSWNMEFYKIFEDWGMMQKWMGDSYVDNDKDASADVFVFMTQEMALVGNVSPGDFFVTKAKPAGAYEVVAEMNVNGCTKPGFLNLGGLIPDATMGISIVAKKGVATKEFVANAKTTIKLKGGVVAGINVDGRKLSFASSHLDAKTPENRGSNLRLIAGSMHKGDRWQMKHAKDAGFRNDAAGKTQFIRQNLEKIYGNDQGLVLIGGDLNYRITADQTTTAHNKKNYLATESCKYDATTGRWGGALVARDTFAQAVQYMKDLGFEPMADQFKMLPTYKRDKTTGATSDCGKLATALKAGKTGNALEADFKACYLKTDPKLKNGDKEVDIGWLDQLMIGPTGHLPTWMRHSEYTQCHECLGGDHSAFSAVIYITGNDGSSGSGAGSSASSLLRRS